jgi:sugar lactone lactonase YvrE
MILPNWLRPRTGNRTSKKLPRRLAVELLEDRAVPAAIAPPSGMVAWWTADGNGVDLIGGNNASLCNGASYAAGKVSQAFNFDGVNDRAQVADTDALKLTASMTIEGWVRADSIPVQSGQILFRGDDRGGLDPYSLGVLSNGNLRFEVVGLNGASAMSVNTPMPIGQLVHVAGTLDDASGAMRLYINGELMSQTTTSVRPFRDLDPASNPSIGIGNHGGYPTSPHNFPFDGQIDELSVYNRALTSDEVQGIYNAGGAGKIKGGNYFAVDAPSVVEGQAGTTSVATFTIWRVGSLTGQATADWATADGTATAGSDFIFAAGPAVFEDGESETTVQITIIGDGTVEPHETFSLVVSTTTPGFTGGEGQVTILNDDVTVSIADTTTIEGDATIRSLGAFVPAGINAPDGPYAMILGADGRLYVTGSNRVYRYDAATGTPLPAPGKSGAEFVAPASGGLNIARDLAFGPDGYLYVVSDGTDAVLRFDPVTGAPAGVSGLPDDAVFIASGSGGLDAPRGVIFQGAYVYVTSVGTETPGFGKDSVLRFDAVTGAPAGVSGLPDDAVFIASGSGGLDNPTRMVFGPDGKAYVSSTATTTNSPTSNSVLRYDETTGAPAGVSGQTGDAVFVSPGSGGLDGPIAMVFRPDGFLYVTSWRNNTVLRYDAITGAFVNTVVPAGSGAASVRDLLFESTGNLLVTSSDDDQIHRYGPGAMAAFTVSLSSPSAVPVTVSYTTANGDGAGAATAGSDYTAASGTLTFAPGETTKTILVQTLPDEEFDPEETFTVNLSNPSTGATIADGLGVGTIYDARELFTANTTTAGIQMMSGETQNIASDAAGNSVVVWQGNGPGDVDGVFFQRFDASGSRVGSQTLVNVVTNTSQYNPVVGRASSNGKFVIAWNSDPYAVIARVYNADGTPATGELTIAVGSATPGNQNYVESIAMDADGDFVVLYRQISRKVFSSTHYWQLQRYNASGQAQGGAMRVASSIPANGQGRVASDANGNFVVAWTQNGIQAQRFTNAGKKVGSQILVSATGVEANVARDADGDFVVTWDNKAQVFNNNGSTRGGVITFPEARGESIAMEADGDFVLTWSQPSPTTGTDVYAQRFDRNGVAKETAHRVNVVTAGNQEHSSVAVANSGNYVVVWNARTLDHYEFGMEDPLGNEVLGRFFTFPAALMAASGNNAEQSSEILRDDQLQPVLAEAIARWMATDLTQEQLAILANLNIQIGNLGGNTLGLASGNTIWIDDDAAGWGWFVDPTPSDDSEFLLEGDQGEQGHMDLLSVLTHEIGHLLGFDHTDGGLMDDMLIAGTRAS